MCNFSFPGHEVLFRVRVSYLVQIFWQLCVCAYSGTCVYTCTLYVGKYGVVCVCVLQEAEGTEK